jgi:hypothetical protein
MMTPLLIAVGIGAWAGLMLGMRNHWDEKKQDERWGAILLSALGGAVIGGIIFTAAAAISGRL